MKAAKRHRGGRSRPTTIGSCRFPTSPRLRGLRARGGADCRVWRRCGRRRLTPWSSMARSSFCFIVCSSAKLCAECGSHCAWLTEGGLDINGWYSIVICLKVRLCCFSELSPESFFFWNEWFVSWKLYVCMWLLIGTSLVRNESEVNLVALLRYSGSRHVCLVIVSEKISLITFIFTKI